MTVSNAEVSILDADYQSELSAARIKQDLSKSEWRSAWIATRDWIEANQAAFNQALPEGVRGRLTAKQKYYLFLRVAEKEYDNG